MLSSCGIARAALARSGGLDVGEHQMRAAQRADRAGLPLRGQGDHVHGQRGLAGHPGSVADQHHRLGTRHRHTSIRSTVTITRAHRSVPGWWGTGGVNDGSPVSGTICTDDARR